ncbi:MAG: histone H1 [Deltaproteobacteria bacterium RIFOXYD12_FULL_50_9]|nr:MAG: histone H1 [Deltaproteobacteria bacterium RIFOXYD12_FULL_50_9]
MKTKRPRDINKLAALIVDQATDEDKPREPEVPQKNQAAVELGRLGGMKGGKARAEKLSPEQRKEIAKKAAKVRWNKK